MGYYSMLKIIRSILYNFRNAIKYICYSILLLLFICICLLLMSNKSSAMTITNGNNTYNLPDFTFSDKFYIGKDGNVFFIWAISNSDDTSYFYRSDYTYLAVSGTAYVYGLNSSGTAWQYGETRSNRNVGASSHVIFSTVNIYSDYNKTSVWFQGTPLRPPFVDPVVSNASSNLAEFISGDFAHFMVVANSADYITFTLNCDRSSAEGINSSVYLVLDGNSPYLLDNYQNGNVFLIPKNILGGYYDNYTYNLILQWEENGNYNNSTTYTWTTELSDTSIVNDNINYQQNIENFLTDDTYNSNDIINNMPNSDDYQSPTESGIDNLFDTFRNAFTTSQSQTVRFVFPNSSGQYIDIRSDLVTSKIPQPILFLIQTFYWYVICRYIIKDIASTAEKAKSGEILDDTNDGNIKTDLL